MPSHLTYGCTDSIRIAPPDAAPPSRRARRRLPHALTSECGQSYEQKWLDVRFSGLTPENFHSDGVAVLAGCSLEPPPSLKESWHAIENCDELLDPAFAMRLQGLAAILLLADPNKQAQVSLIIKTALLINDILGDGVDGPPIFWVPHTTLPEQRAQMDFDAKVYDDVMNNGVDEILPDEPQGIMLALAVRSKIKKQIELATKLDKMLELKAKAKSLEESIDTIVWQYLRLRLKTEIPQIPSDWTEGMPQTIESWQIGSYRGDGNSGKVYSLVTPGQAQSGQVVKCIAKESKSSIRELEGIKHQVQIMKLLSRDRVHPNITKFYEIYHSSTHILLRMEDGGPVNLYQRLQLRAKRMKGEDVEGGDLPVDKVLQIINQSTSAMAHLHACDIAHRDIKPKNMCIEETSKDVTLKVIDFDAAIGCTRFQQSNQICGTFPFTAPEVYLEETSHPLPADVWSLGIMQCEVICGLHFLQGLLDLRLVHDRYKEKCRQKGQKVSGLGIASFLTQKIIGFLQREDAISEVIRRHVFDELQSWWGPLEVMLGRMLLSQAPHRSTAAQLLHLSRTTLNAVHVNEMSPVM